ncbi:MAG: zinc ribbon domain-containing protein [Chloroflexota bacterium]
MRVFCTRCWTDADSGMQHCPACGADLAWFDKLSYEDKLIRALRHPVMDHQLMAITVLGQQRSERAVPYLCALLASEDNVYVLREVLLALARIGGPLSEAALAAATGHRARLVRQLAQELLIEGGHHSLAHR